MEQVKKPLLDVGWKDVYFTGIHDLKRPIADPEKEGKVFIVAKK